MRRAATIVISLIVLALPSFGYAISANDSHAVQYDTPFFDPNATSSGASCGSIALTGSDDENKIWNYLTGKGLQPFQAAGMMGNIQSESGFNPASQEPGTTSDTPTPGQLGHGIVQWTPGTQLIAPAQAAGTPVNDLGFQLNYLWAEISTGSESNILPIIQATTNVTDATEAFETKFERHAGPPQPARVSQAQAILAKYGSGAVDTGGGSDTGAVTGCNSGSPGQYENPFRDIKPFTPSRIDAGVDFSGAGTVYAYGDGKITLIHAPANSGWTPNDIFISETFSDGPAAGKTAYIAECITPDPALTVGMTVTSSTVIGQMTNCGSGIETGWASSGDVPLGHFGGSNSTAAGVNFSQFLQSLGAPGGILNAPVTDSLPPGWPTW